MTELIGWFAATVLLAAIGRQVYTQWRGSSTRGLSPAFYWPADRLARFHHLQLDARKLGIRRHNGLMLVAAALGQWVYLANQRHPRSPVSARTNG